MTPGRKKNTLAVRLEAEVEALIGTAAIDDWDFEAIAVTYSAAIERAAQNDTDELPNAFVARAEREAARRGFNRAQRRVVLGDGAKWIWNLATEHFADAIQIVDRFHAKQHLSDVAKAIYGPNNDLDKQWAHATSRRTG